MRTRRNPHSSPAPRAARSDLPRAARYALLIAAALLAAGCAQAPPAASLRHDRELTVVIGTGTRPSRTPPALAIVHTTTATPLSLWLSAATVQVPATPRRGLALELEVVDVHGNRVAAADAVVQPGRLLTDANGIAGPITFLAAVPGDYVVRAIYFEDERRFEARGPWLRASRAPAR